MPLGFVPIGKTLNWVRLNCLLPLPFGGVGIRLLAHFAFRHMAIQLVLVHETHLAAQTLKWRHARRS